MHSPGTKTVVLANHTGFTGQYIDDRFPRNEAMIWYDGSAALADHALFWADGDAVVVTPSELESRLVEDVRRFFGAEDLTVVAAAAGANCTLESALNKSEVGERISRMADRSTGVNVLAWGLTPGLAAFLRRLEQDAPSVRASGLPSPELLWLVQQFDSKPGFRLLAAELARKHSCVRLPEGFILPDLESAFAAVQQHFFTNSASVVLKAARGTGGYSTLLLPYSTSTAERSRVLRRGRSLARFDTFWATGPVVVERFIGGADGAVPDAYTVDADVSRDGRVEVLCVGRMLIDAGKRYGGVTIGNGAVDQLLCVQLTEVARVFGAALAERGFTGLFDLDFVVDQHGLAWVCEMNVRRASPGHVIAIARRTFGSTWATSGAVLGRDYVKLQGSQALTYEGLSELVQAFRRRSPATHQLIVTQASSSLRRKSPSFGYALAARDVATCELEAARFERYVYTSLGLNLDALGGSSGGQHA
jgi:hypothetical protein